MGNAAPRDLLLRHPNKDFLLSERQHCAALCALQVYDQPGTILQPQIAAARGAETGGTGALCVSAGKSAMLASL
jgi:hypothetical protein